MNFIRFLIDEMVMGFDAGIINNSSFLDNLGSQNTLLSEEIQGVVDGRPGDGGRIFLDDFPDLVSRQMDLGLENSLSDSYALRSRLNRMHPE